LFSTSNADEKQQSEANRSIEMEVQLKQNRADDTTDPESIIAGAGCDEFIHMSSSAENSCSSYILWTLGSPQSI
jgi:hypothetical protein